MSSSTVAPVDLSIPKSRKAARVSALLDRHLAAYALVASAAGASATAVAQTPNRNTIDYTPADITYESSLGSHGSHIVNIDLNHDGITDIVIDWQAYGSYSHARDAGYYWALAAWSAPIGNGGMGLPLASGIEIGPMRTFVSGGLFAKTISSYRDGRRHERDGCEGPFKNRTTYLGIRFMAGNETHYGWVHLSVNCGPDYDGVQGTITGYAYNMLPDGRIAAGQKESGKPTKKEESTIPGTLGALSLGSTGLPLWRK
jgi:hypothetical protein